jgi:hypothetical protein
LRGQIQVLARVRQALAYGNYCCDPGVSSPFENFVAVPIEDGVAQMGMYIYQASFGHDPG